MDSPTDNQDRGSDNERRMLYRVDETAILEVLPVSDEDISSKTAEQCFDESPAFGLMRDLRAMDSDNANILRTVHDKSPEVALYLQAINKKIDIMGNAVAASLLSEDQRLQSVDLSAGGIGFGHDSRLEEGKTYAIKIWFHQTLFGIAAFIEVVACHRAIDGGYHISCSFKSLPDADESVIARHIMQVQAKQQRLKHGLDE